MAHPVIGWERATAVPDGHFFNDYLQARGGRLFFDDLDLAQLLVGGDNPVGAGQAGNPSLKTGPMPFQPALPSPLEVVVLPRIRQQIHKMGRVFAEAIRATGYPGQFHYAYASKANAAEEVIRTTLAAGAHHEMSSFVDVEISRIMKARGLLPPQRMVVCNGFKPAGSGYARRIVAFRQEHERIIPVVEDLSELPPLIESGLAFDVGLRQKSYGHHANEAEMDAANSRFGLDLDNIWKAADYIKAAPNLTLTMVHAMVGSQIVDDADFVQRLTPPLELYARLRQRHPTLRIFNFGGGVPVGLTLAFAFDYAAWARRLLTTIQAICRRYDVPPPDVMGEFGRYTVAEHGMHLFRVVTVKENNSPLPWAIMDGSIMTSFPDAWALGEHFIVLPLNHLDKPFQQVQLGGITCDSDDVYPPKASQSPLYLPVETDDLTIGFFGIGAYQEMLGGVRGTKHCAIPEANELIVDRGEDGRYTFELVPGQTAAEALRNLGYRNT